MIEEIKTKIQNSILEQEDKNFLLQNLDKMNDQQQSELLGLLNDAEKKLAEEVDKIKAESYQKLSVDMKNLSKQFFKKASTEIEAKEKSKEEIELQNLDESLKNAR
ncbi:MAG: hypothetical protein AAB836_01970 [Patescibacteria group bacterium]